MNLRGLLRRREPDPATVSTRVDTEDFPALSSDHTFDFTADDFSSPPTVFMPPELTHLAAMLGGFSPERVQILREAETPNGWPEWWSRRFHGDDLEAWDVFKEMCLEALESFHTDGIPIENSLLAYVQDMEQEGREADSD